MKTYDEAIRIIEEQGASLPLPLEDISVRDCPGRICATEIAAPMAYQPFDNSAMDGICLRAGDIVSADEAHPVRLRIHDEIAAGDPPSDEPTPPGTCRAIMTGAPVPGDCDCVVPVEQIRREEGDAVLTAPGEQGANIRRAGEDFQEGDMVLKAGDRLDHQHIMVLTTLGITRMQVIRKPRIGLISTGTEIVDDLGKDLQPGQIYNSNRHYLESLIPATGAELVHAATITDDKDTLRAQIEDLCDKGCDLILTTGAVSAGAYDIVKPVLEDLGASIHFHKLKIKPAKPVLFARIDNGPLFMGLPGNPVSSMVALRFFAHPLLRVMQSLPPEQPGYARIANAFTNKKDFRIFLKARLSLDNAGQANVKILEGQESFKVSPFLQANCWAVAPEGPLELNSGTAVAVYPLHPGGGFADLAPA